MDALSDIMVQPPQKHLDSYLINFRVCLSCTSGVFVEGARTESLAVVSNLSCEHCNLGPNAGCLCFLNWLNLILDLQS